MAETKETKPGVEPKKVTVSILPALARAFGADFMVGVLLKLANDLIIFVNPILLGFGSSHVFLLLLLWLLLSLLLLSLESTD